MLFAQHKLLGAGVAFDESCRLQHCASLLRRLSRDADLLEPRFWTAFPLATFVRCGCDWAMSIEEFGAIRRFDRIVVIAEHG